MNRGDLTGAPSAGALLRLIVLGAMVVSCGGEAPSDGGGAGLPGGAEERMPRTGMGMGGMMAMMENMPEGIAADELPDPDSRGARLIVRYCSQCHGIPTPRRLSADEWEPTVRRMLVRMERMSRMPMHRTAVPSPDEVENLLSYLQANALRSVPAGSLLTDDPRSALFARTCSRCHALPDPDQHTADQWPAVVERMRENMRRMQVEEITDGQTRRIIDFLQAHAADGGTV